jgi:hypothetical protein
MFFYHTINVKSYLSELKKGVRHIAPLTQHMLDLLLECRERELRNIEPFDIGSAHYAEGLLRRKLLEAKKFTTEKGKQLMGLFITDLGHEYLSRL